MDQKYLSLKETAAKWGIGNCKINVLCLENRISGAFKVGNSWAIQIMLKNYVMNKLSLESM